MASFHAQQKALFDKFCQLRQKYDGLKAHLKEVLWDYIPSCRIPGVEGQGPHWLEAIPEVDKSVVEEQDCVGGERLVRCRTTTAMLFLALNRCFAYAAASASLSMCLTMTAHISSNTASDNIDPGLPSLVLPHMPTAYLSDHSTLGTC